MKKIVLSTRNPSKAEQIRAIFEGTGMQILSLDDVGIEGDAIEDGMTLQENALKKTLFARNELEAKEADNGFWFIADDTGLFINHLNGRPGIKAARWAGETASTDEIMAYTLDQLKDAEDRSARFETAVSLISPDREEHFFSGHIDGILLPEPRTIPQPKMPYSPLFQPDGENLTWAEMSTDYENEISHRGKAFRAALEFLREQM